MRKTASYFFKILSILLFTVEASAQTNFNVDLGSSMAYIKQGENFTVKGSAGTPYYVYHFSTDFMPAPPPMIENPNLGNPMVVDSSFQIMANEAIDVKSTGLYFIQSDTASREGVGFMSVPEDFPKYRKMRHIYPPMIYISTQNEMMSFKSGDRPRLAFENFWLNVAGSPDNAKRMIKMYFDRVTEANIKFTDYKEGWKTDRGIVYIIFGEPNEVSNIDGGIRWSYESNLNHGQVEFDFMEDNNQFTGTHYELKRSFDYKRVWFDTVKKWRNGTIQ
ncbi:MULTISPECIES: GWxTD domain-containing protein [Flammeovirga]|uniref:GWxTD domain-containing protein n=1 Tax=Flammeovirga agarivorans TaxID=2726742 RepID=A0A7X8XYY3_9BACT|nr:MULTISPECIES: GWxTD domain-containing protein [Flammeovirga]NLR94652.1 GWxTD domain-containing protein [Flammeovirga agarivorans]